MKIRDSNTHVIKIAPPVTAEGTEIDRSLIKDVIVTFGTKPQIKKHLEWNERNYCYPLFLTQEDTRLMRGGENIECDIKVVYIDGSVRSTDIESFDVAEQVNIDMIDI